MYGRQTIEHRQVSIINVSLFFFVKVHYYSILKCHPCLVPESAAGGAVGVVKQETKRKAPRQEVDSSVAGKKKRRKRNFMKGKKGKKDGKT